MYITKIEIDGFKSYGNYQALDNLDTQFNAITGLNGSGKSNILDSICFLLGISHLQYIRAENNEDLVFRKGQSGVTKATVTITFDNRDPKHKPIGYESDNTIVIRRQIVLNGKQTYHVNGLPSSAAKVSDLFNSVSMNVNNPHFLIMQGRVTKVLNMKPREILLMIEEAAGVRVYEAKRRAAMTTIERKEHKMENMNKMMDDEILPRLNKLRGERDLYNEYLKLGRDIEHQERLQICLEFWRAFHSGVRYREALSARVEENKQSKEEIKQLGEQIKTEERTLEEMQKHSETLSARETDLSAAKRHKESEVLEKRSEMKKSEEDLKELDQKLSQQRENINQDKDRLKKKSRDLENAQNRHGNDAERKKEAQKQLEQCKATLEALERGLLTDEDGKQMSLNEKIHNLKNKHSKEETTVLRIESNLNDARGRLKRAQNELSNTVGKRASNTLDLKKTQLEEEIKNLETEVTRYTNISVERDDVASSKRQLLSEVRQQEDKRHDYLSRYPWLDFKHRQCQGLNPNNIIGPLAKLIHLKDTRYATALETALGGVMMNVVVRTRDTAKLLLAHGGLERRVTFIPLDTIQHRPFEQKRFTRAQELVGENNVFRAIDLIEFDKSIYGAVEHALGQTLVCTSPDAAKTVCFDQRVKTRVVTFDGDDYNPAGLLSGGSNHRRHSVLSDLVTIQKLEQKIHELNARLTDLDADWTSLQRSIDKKNELEERLSARRFEYTDIMEQIRTDPTSRLKSEIDGLVRMINEKEEELKAAQPAVDELNAKLKELEEQKRNEAAYRKAEEKKASKGVEEAERILKNLEKNSSTAIEQLELNRLDVETLANQIENDEQDFLKEEQKRQPLLDEIHEIKEAYDKLNRLFQQTKRDFDEFMVDYRRHEREIKQKQEHINTLKKNERDKINSEADFKRDCAEFEEKARECEKSATLTERQHSWITDEKEHFNKPGTQYDFRDMTTRDIQNHIRSMKERREELDCRVNVEAMRSLAEEEDRANDLDGKRKGLQDDREKLQRTIYEIDTEKKRELENACKKISRDFGAIFSTILPGVTAKLKAIDEDDLAQGLQIRVAFNNQWKESLDELSGGQRSLVALSLILAMLKCNPAPIYILDEVDAALDLSHTANIGTMIKQHFKESQFIIVSLKEGMFNNANVIYRTQFVNGSSKVFRTENNR